MQTIAVFSSPKAKSSPENVDIAIELIHSNISLKNVFRMVTYEDHGTKSITEDIWRKAMEKRFPIGLVRFTPVWKQMDGGKAFYPHAQDDEKVVSQIEEIAEVCFVFVAERKNELKQIDLVEKYFNKSRKQVIIFSVNNYSIL